MILLCYELFKHIGTLSPESDIAGRVQDILHGDILSLRQRYAYREASTLFHCHRSL